LFHPDLYLCCDSPASTDNKDLFGNGKEIIEDAPNESDTNDFFHNDDLGLDNFNDDLCDESKCLSQLGFGYTCWGSGPGTVNPFRCSDGYAGRPVKGESESDDMQYPVFMAGFRNLFHYYTCCPPDHPIDVPSIRHCSDPITLLGGTDKQNKSALCDYDDDDQQQRQLKHPRFMIPYFDVVTSTKVESYVCCDSSFIDEEDGDAGDENTNITTFITSNNPTSFLEDVDCVPVCSTIDVYQCLTRNQYGYLTPMTCDHSASSKYHEFKYPNHVFTIEDPSEVYQGLTRHECCRTPRPISPDGAAAMDSGPFIKDRFFILTVWPQIVVSSIALALCFLFIAGLIVTTGFSVQEGDYNGYNYYLVLLALPDAFLNAAILVLYGGYVKQSFSKLHAGQVVFFTHSNGENLPIYRAFIVGCSTANLYVNAVIAHEVYGLLDRSHRLIRQTPPTLKHASIQASAVYLYAVLVFLLHYYLDGRNKVKLLVSGTIQFMLTAGIPLIYICRVAYVVRKRGLLPSLGVCRERELALYFGRIFVVFFGCWVPGLALIMSSRYTRTVDTLEWLELGNEGIVSEPWLYPVGLLFVAVQAIVSIGMALTKTDVRKSFVDFVTLSSCRSAFHGK